MALNFKIASAIEGTNTPPIPKAQGWAASYLAQKDHLPLLDLSQGVPRAAPHPSVLEALSKTSSDPQSARYGPILGQPELRAALAEEMNQLYQLSSDSPKIAAENIGITAGCNMAFLTIIMALCPPGSKILVPLPVYFNCAMTLSLQSVIPEYIPCDPTNGFTPSLASAREALEKEDHGIRMISLISPNNPTGAVIPHGVMEEWFDLAKEKGVALVVDETYRDFVEGEGGRGVPHNLFRRKDWQETLISLGSFSKGYRIPGHRLGSITASPILLQHICTICDCMQICPPRPPQLALSPLLPSLRTDLLESSTQLSHRRHLFQKTVDAIPGWSVSSMGGFFAYVQFPREYITAGSSRSGKKRPMGSEDVSRVLAKECGVITLPGCFFMPDLGDSVWDRIKDAETLREDRWIRFAVANVEDDVILQLGPRLQMMNKIMGMEEDSA